MAGAGTAGAGVGAAASRVNIMAAAAAASSPFNKSLAVSRDRPGGGSNTSISGAGGGSYGGDPGSQGPMTHQGRGSIPIAGRRRASIGGFVATFWENSRAHKAIHTAHSPALELRGLPTDLDNDAAACSAPSASPQPVCCLPCCLRIARRHEHHLPVNRLHMRKPGQRDRRQLLPGAPSAAAAGQGLRKLNRHGRWLLRAPAATYGAQGACGRWCWP